MCAGHTRPRASDRPGAGEQRLGRGRRSWTHRAPWAPVHPAWRPASLRSPPLSLGPHTCFLGSSEWQYCRMDLPADPLLRESYRSKAQWGVFFFQLVNMRSRAGSEPSYLTAWHLPPGRGAGGPQRPGSLREGGAEEAGGAGRRANTQATLLPQPVAPDLHPRLLVTVLEVPCAEGPCA